MRLDKNMKKTIIIAIGAVIVAIAGYLLLNRNIGASIPSLQTTNLKSVTSTDNGKSTAMDVAIQGGVTLANPTNGAATASNLGTVNATSTLYFKITSLDYAGGQTMPSDQFTCSIVPQHPSASSTSCTITFTPTTGGAGSRLWVGTSTGVFYGYLTATSSTLVATTTGLTLATIPTANTAYMALPNEKYGYYATSTAGTYVVKSAPGFLHTITINNDAAGTLTIYDNTAGSGTKIATLEASAAVGSYIYDVAFSTGLTIVGAAATDITVSYK